MSQLTNYSTDWNNIDLTSYQRNLNILEPYNFETLLLELRCNTPTKDLTKEAILSHAKAVLMAKYTEAMEILESNAENVLKYELEDTLKVSRRV